MNTKSLAAASIGFVFLAAACGSEAKGGGGEPSQPKIGPAHLDPSQFVKTVDNPYFPLEPGTVWEYKAKSSEGEERIVVTVTDKTKVVDGVTAIVVHDEVSEGGKLIEDTYDWYAQDKDGNVWYLGEDTTSYADGAASKKGSWEAGVDGARAGHAMMGKPTVGESYYQEYYKGEAEDEGKVLAIDESVTGPTGSYDHVVKTADSTKLEPDLLEHKWYAPGVGFVKEAYMKGGDETVTLVKMTRP